MTNYTLPNNQSEKLAELNDYVRVIESISPSDTEFHDLEFLREILKDKQIIMLGEQTHKDGATFLAKSRLIKFLHKELGFDVLIYETGFYDTENLWKSLKNNAYNNLTDFSKALYPFWYMNQETEEILEYIVERISTENEIQISGLDVQFSGQIGDQERDSLLTQYLYSRPEINATKYPAFFSIKHEYSNYANKWVADQLSATKKDSILKDINSINKLYASDSLKSSKDLLYSRFFKNIEVLYTYSWNYDIGEDIRFHIRDSAMAENFIWLKENKFKNNKVIVWAANLHTSYDNYSYNPVPAKFTSMGEYIKKEYGGQCYSIHFTSFYDPDRLNYSEKMYNNKSVEYLLHQINRPYLYLDFNEIDSTSFLQNENIMNCNQRLSFNAQWSKITDGIFYIDKMTGLNSIKGKDENNN